MAISLDFVGIYTLGERNKFLELGSDDKFKPFTNLGNYSFFTGSSSSSVKTVFSLSEYHQFLCIANSDNISSLKTGIAYFIGGFSGIQGIDTMTAFTQQGGQSFRFSTSTSFIGSSNLSSTLPRAAGCGVAGWSISSGYVIGGASSANFYSYSPSPATEPKNGTSLPGWSYLSSTHKLTFFTTTLSSAPSINLSTPAAFNGSLEDDNSGYILGGYYQPSSPTVASFSNVHKLTYSTESLTLLSNKMVYPIDSFATASDRETKGYTLGGVNSVSGTFISSVSKLTYSTDTSSNVSTAKSYIPMINVSGVGNYAKTAGYFSGGVIGYSGSFSVFGFPNGSFSINHRIFTSTIQKISYSTEAVSSLSNAHLKGNLAPAAPIGEPSWSSFYGSSIVPGNRGFTSAVSSKNYFMVKGGYSEYILQQGSGPGSIGIFEWNWYEIDSISYSTETNFPQNQNSFTTGPARSSQASFSTVQ